MVSSVRQARKADGVPADLGTLASRPGRSVFRHDDGPIPVRSDIHPENAPESSSAHICAACADSSSVSGRSGRFPAFGVAPGGPVDVLGAMLQVKDTLRATVHLGFDGRVFKTYHGPDAPERFANEVRVQIGRAHV